MTHYVILGSGVAGIGAAEAIRGLDIDGQITFISDDPHGYYSRPGLAYYLTDEVAEKQLFPYQPQDYRELRAEFLHGSVVHIYAVEHQVELAGGQRIPYDRLLIAVGSGAIPLNVPGANLDGVVKLDHLEDARKLLRLAKHARTAVVVGGGITALELAEGLVSRRVKVHLLIRTARYWSNVLDEEESEIIQHRLIEHGLIIHYGAQLSGIMENKGRVAAVNLEDGGQIPCDLLAYGIGVQPRLTLAQEAGIACDRGILVNEHLRTSIPEIYAAGDVAQVYDPASGRSVIDSLWSPAREQGNAAGANMAGQDKVYIKPVPFNVTRLAGLTTTIIGMVGSGKEGEPLTIARGDSETWRRMPNAVMAQTGFEVNHLRLMVGDKSIVGAIVMGDQKLSPALQVIIRDQVDISPIREQLITPKAPIAEIMAGFWKQLSARNN